MLAAAAQAADTDLIVDVTGTVAEVSLHRRFRRPESDGPAIDAQLFLPIPSGAAVDGVAVTVGDRLVQSRVLPAAAARAMHEAAAARGQTSVLLDQVHDDLLVQDVANVLPGDTVDVEVRLVVPVARAGDGWELVLPLTASPRFGDDVDLVSIIPRETIEQQPAWVPRTARPEDRGDVEVSVHAGTPIAWLESPTHPFHVDLDRDEGYLTVADTPLDRDVVVRWATAAADPAASLVIGGDYGLLTVEAPAPWARVSRNPLDLVVLIDESDSMIGPRSALVPDVLAALLADLGPDDRVTVLRYADWVEGLAVRAAPSEAAELPDLLRRAPIPGGGSDLAGALSMALRVPAPPERPVAVVVVSDGGTGKESDVLAALSVRPNAVVHTVAVGAAPSHALLDRLAERSGGVAVSVRPGASVVDALGPLRDGLGPILTDLRVDWGAESGRAPTELRPLYRGQVTHLSVQGASCARSIALTGQLAGRPWTAEVQPRCGAAERPLEVLWTRQEMDAHPDQAAALAIDHQVLGPGTMFAGVDGRIVNPGGVASNETVGVYQTADVLSTAAGLEEIEVAAGASAELQGTGRPRGKLVLDGLDVTDPAMGAFSPELLPSRIALTGASTDEVEIEGGGEPIAEASTRTPPGSSEGRLSGGWSWPGGGEAAVDLAGPLVRPVAYAVAARAAEIGPVRTADLYGWLGERDGNHELYVAALGEPSEVRVGASSRPYGLGIGLARWRWQDGRLAFDASGAVVGGQVAGIDRQRLVARSVATAWGEHGSGWLGAEVRRVAWDPGISREFATGLAGAEAHGRAARLTLGGRVDAGDGLVLPAGHVGLELWPDAHVRPRIGAARELDLDRASVSVPRTDRGWLEIAARSGAVTTTLGSGLTRERLPFEAPPGLAPWDPDPPEVDRVRASATARLESRWFELGWTLGVATPPDLRLLRDPAAPYVPGFLDAYRVHQVEARLVWTAPWAFATDLDLGGRWASPILAGSPQWWLRSVTVATGSIRQRLTRGKVAVALRATGDVAVGDPSAGPIPLAALATASPGAPDVTGEPPCRASIALEIGPR